MRIDDRWYNIDTRPTFIEILKLTICNQKHKMLLQMILLNLLLPKNSLGENDADLKDR